MVDHGEADDKIVAVLANDDVFGGVCVASRTCRRR
jgi:hypothetical protein